MRGARRALRGNEYSTSGRTSYNWGANQMNVSPMTNLTSKFLIALAVLASPVLWGQATESSITKQLQNLGAIPGPRPDMGASPSKPTVIPDAQRPAMILQLAKDIGALPAGNSKVKLADGLDHAAVQGESGKEALQAAADTLAQALSETAQQPGKDGLPAKPYMDLAKLARYAGIMTSLKDPQVAKADEVLVANDADVAKADFTLKDVNGKKVTFSSLKGKIVLVDFWSGPLVCGACAKEMTDLDLIQVHYGGQGLVILSILSPTPDDVFSLNRFLMMGAGYHPRVLLDDGGKVAKMFHVDSQPRSFVFDRDGKLVAESIDMCTQRQFFAMLAAGGLHP
jgi:peroxiredoxin